MRYVDHFKTYFYLFLSVALFSCAQKESNKINPESARLTNKITPLISFINNPDSCRKALLFLDSATSIDRNNFSAHYNKLIFLNGLKQYDRAINTIDELIRLKPNAHDLFLMKGNFYERKGDTISSRKCFLKSLAICNEVLDTMDRNNRDYVMLVTNKATNLIMLGDSVKANKILKVVYANLADDSAFDNVEKKYILSLMNKNEDQLLHIRADTIKLLSAPTR